VTLKSRASLSLNPVHSTGVRKLNMSQSVREQNTKELWYVSYSKSVQRTIFKRNLKNKSILPNATLIKSRFKKKLTDLFKGFVFLTPQFCCLLVSLSLTEPPWCSPKLKICLKMSQNQQLVRHLKNSRYRCNVGKLFRLRKLAWTRSIDALLQIFLPAAPLGGDLVTVRYQTATRTYYRLSWLGRASYLPPLSLLSAWIMQYESRKNVFLF